MINYLLDPWNMRDMTCAIIKEEEFHRYRRGTLLQRTLVRWRWQFAAATSSWIRSDRLPSFSSCLAVSPFPEFSARNCSSASCPSRPSIPFCISRTYWSASFAKQQMSILWILSQMFLKLSKSPSSFSIPASSLPFFSLGARVSRLSLRKWIISHVLRKNASQKWRHP